MVHSPPNTYNYVITTAQRLCSKSKKKSPLISFEIKGQSSGGVLLSRDYPSIMGAEELDDRVRDGNGYDLLAITTRSNVQRVGRYFCWLGTNLVMVEELRKKGLVTLERNGSSN